MALNISLRLREVSLNLLRKLVDLRQFILHLLDLFLSVLQFLLVLGQSVDLLLEAFDVQFHLLLTADMVSAFSFKLSEELFVLFVGRRD